MSSPGISVLSQPQPLRFALRDLPSGIRVFENAKLQSAIDQAAAALGSDKTYAAVAHHVYRDDGTRIENVTKVSFIVRGPAGISVAVGAYKDWSGGDQGAEGKIIWAG